MWLRDAPENVGRAQEALLRFGAPRSVIDALLTLEELDVVWMGSAPARIDLMKGVPGGDFTEAWRARVAHIVAGTVVLVVSREELIRLERASERPQDACSAPS